MVPILAGEVKVCANKGDAANFKHQRLQFATRKRGRWLGDDSWRLRHFQTHKPVSRQRDRCVIANKKSFGPAPVVDRYGSGQ